MIKNLFTFSYFTLFVALNISAIAAYYSVIGLAAIFAGASTAIIIMGATLEISKITTTVWLHRYWNQASWTIKTYLTTAVIVLAFLTSMGIFGFLSKAHSDQSLISGDSQAKIAIFDEKIKTARENIDANRKALKQMDDAVEQTMGRSTSEQGADKAVQIRRSQQKERNRLLADIEAEQKKISQLMEDRAPLAAETRKIEAEVGPIKYIAALIYGDNPDSNLLERAVRWVIILIVCVFDPLAIILILAANNSLIFDRQKQQNKIDETPLPTLDSEDEWNKKISEVENSTPWPTEWDELDESMDDQVESTVLETIEESEPESSDTETITPEYKKYIQSPYTNVTYSMKPVDINLQSVDTPTVTDVQENSSSNSNENEVKSIKEDKPEPFIQTDGVTVQASVDEDRYVNYQGKKTSIAALKQMNLENEVEKLYPNEIIFASKFPEVARSGDISVRIDVMPHRVYKFNGIRWIQLDKNSSTSYLQNVAYLQYLISKIDTGEYDPQFLTEAEQDEISSYLTSTK